MPAELLNVHEAPSAFTTRLALPSLISPGAGKEALQIGSQLESIENIRSGVVAISPKPFQFKANGRGSPQARGTVPARPASLQETLFQTRARLKVMTSQVAMHLSEHTRTWLFTQLDDLLDPEVWHEDDTLVNPASYATYLRLLIYYGRVKVASLGISNIGNLLAAWLTLTGRLTMEFVASDHVRWALSCGEGEAREMAAGQCGVRRIDTVLDAISGRRLVYRRCRHRSPVSIISRGIAATAISSGLMAKLWEFSVTHFR